MIKNRKIWISLLKGIIVIVAWIYVGFKLTEFKDSFNSLETISFSQFQIFELFTVCSLMLINWSIEAKKWQYSLQSITHVSFYKAVKTVLMGTTIGIISPNRAGEPWGRVSLLEPRFREAGISAGILCSIGQFSSTIIAGCFALPFFINQQLYFSNSFPAFGIAIVCIIIILLLFFNIKRLSILLRRVPLIKNYDSFINHFQSISTTNLAIILFYSTIRYCVFLLQFFLILKVFSINISFQHSCIAVGIVYLITTLIPTTTLAELGIRCSSSVYFIGIYDNRPLLIITASLFVWIINLSFPVLIGSLFYLPTRKTSKSENVQKK